MTEEWWNCMCDAAYDRIVDRMNDAFDKGDVPLPLVKYVEARMDAWAMLNFVDGCRRIGHDPIDDLICGCAEDLVGKIAHGEIKEDEIEW